MSVSTARNLLEAVSHFHKQLGLYCEKNARTHKDERVRMLLDYVGRHEYHMAEVLKNYEEQAKTKVLNTWFNNLPAKLLEAPGNGDLTVDSSVDDVIAWAVRMDDSVIDLYRTMAAEAATAEVKKLVNALLEMEEREKLNTVRSALRINDI